jgi:hypothetical protein
MGKVAVWNKTSITGEAAEDAVGGDIVELTFRDLYQELKGELKGREIDQRAGAWEISLRWHEE